MNAEGIPMETYSFPYLSPAQSRTREPSEWEMNLAGALEAAFGAGHQELPALVEALNRSRVRPRQGGSWTEANFTVLMRELDADPRRPNGRSGESASQQRSKHDPLADHAEGA